MNNTTFNAIRTVGEIAVPVIAFITAICTIWNIPHCAEVMILRKRYNEGKTNG
jgi:hypothetical protein